MMRWIRRVNVPAQRNRSRHRLETTNNAAFAAGEATPLPMDVSVKIVKLRQVPT
jgi:hypothetical protein